MMFSDIVAPYLANALVLVLVDPDCNPTSIMFSMQLQLQLQLSQVSSSYCILWTGQQSRAEQTLICAATGYDMIGGIGTSSFYGCCNANATLLTTTSYKLATFDDP